MFDLMVEWIMAHAANPSTSSERDAAIAHIETSLRELLSLLPSTPAGAAEASNTIEAVERLGRLMDADRVRAALPLVAEPRLVEQLGFTSATSAVAALASIKESSARSRTRVAEAVTPDSDLTGAILPPPLPSVAAALEAGSLGLDAAALIVSEVRSVATRVDRDVLECAEQAMVELATGLDGSGSRCSAPVSVDYLSTEVRHITCAIDPDGARPREQRAVRRRELRLGVEDADGLVPLHGRLLPETALLLSALIEAHRRSPRFSHDPQDSLLGESAGETDDRTRAQRAHDAFAEIVGAAAASSDAPRLDGAPVTVLVTVSARDLNSDGADGDAIGTMADVSQPVSRRTVERFIDAHGYREVALDPHGAIAGISSVQRCFTPAQRSAIAARDGARCATPGCTSPHYTLQAHHVVPVRDGGPTTTSNGILLCFWHHQQVDTGIWRYGMIGGVPHARRDRFSEWMPIGARRVRAVA